MIGAQYECRLAWFFLHVLPPAKPTTRLPMDVGRDKFHC